ncbi:MAG: helix-turn-helix transcriptional regulator [Pseudobutyrivibrio sp.]|nr:helix-turn-helix transcriptional regulator [Pseudobutyrivibrio sp.]
MNTRIKNLRTELGLSQEDFAKQLNISRNFIWMIEKGEREPSDRTVLDICRIFHVNEDWLRTGMGEMFQNKSRETEIAEMTAAMFKADESDKRYQLMRLLNSISDDELETFFAAAKRWVDSVGIKNIQ